MNELEVCDRCRPHYDPGRDMWWPADCSQCTARFRVHTCECICAWVLTDYAIPGGTVDADRL